jgi:hypothetical protein
VVWDAKALRQKLDDRMAESSGAEQDAGGRRGRDSVAKAWQATVALASAGGPAYLLGGWRKKTTDEGEADRD